MKITLTSASILLVAGFLCGCDSMSTLNTQEVREELASQYDLGRKARALMVKDGIETTDKTCGDLWTTSGADEHRVNDGYLPEDRNAAGPKGRTTIDEFKAWFVSGCMGRPSPDEPAVTEPAVTVSPTL